MARGAEGVGVEDVSLLLCYAVVVDASRDKLLFQATRSGHVDVIQEVSQPHASCCYFPGRKKRSFGKAINQQFGYYYEN